ncbi:MAG: SusE domain-containing protein [Alistipes sp.]|nr:SusE domain-containing protein [Alistipes sp.]MBQ5394120.1 SusE domain-containing protein [Alistipes sp.]MBR0331108.1 SusE domain-containing protein [Alistipes sp.]
MKYIKFLSMMLAAAMTFVACETDVDQPQLLPESEFVAPALNAQGDVVINGDNIKVEKVTFTCTEADFGQPIQVNYKLYFAKDGVEAFVAENSAPAITVEKATLNGVVVNNLGVAANESATIDAYVVAYAGDSGMCTEKSNVISFNVQTFKAALRNYYICGFYNGWNAGAALTIWETAGGSNIYEGLYNFTEDATNTPGFSGFKVLTNQAWDGGEMGYSAFTASSKFSSSSDGNLMLPAGIWQLSVDLLNMTIDAKQFSQVDIMGSFDGWASPLVLEFDTVNNVWKTPTPIAAGSEYKIRMNGSWDVSYGGGVAASESIPEGFEIEGGDNIKIPGSGNVYVNLHADRTPWVVTYTPAE